MARYVEFECPNEACSMNAAGQTWEMYARVVDYGDSYDLVAVSDGPGLSGGSDRCPACGEVGDEL